MILSKSLVKLLARLANISLFLPSFSFKQGLLIFYFAVYKSL